MTESKRIKNWAIVGAFLAAYSIALLYFFSTYLNFPNRPLGVDAVPHAAKVSILRYWGLEAFRWFPTYYFGNPHFTFYTPSTYVLPWVVSSLLDLAPEQIIRLFNWMAYVSVMLNVLGVAALVYYTCGQKSLPVLASMAFLVTSPALLEPWIWGGNYPELLASPAIPWGLLFLERWLKTHTRSSLIAYVLLGAFAIYGHQAIGFFFLLGSLVWALTTKSPIKESLKRFMTVGLLLLCISSAYIMPLSYFERTSKIRPTFSETISYPFSIGDYFPAFFMLRIPFLQKTSESLPGTNLLAFIIAFTCYILSNRKRIGARVIAFSLIPITMVIHFVLVTAILLPWIAGFHPARYLFIITIYASIVIGMIAQNVSHKHNSFVLSGVAIIVTAHCLYPPDYTVCVGTFPEKSDLKFLDELKASATQNSFRIGGIYDGFFNFITFYHPDYYLSRGYYAQGILFIDWQAWFEHTIDGAPPSIASKNALQHLLDWGAVKYLGLAGKETSMSTVSNTLRARGNFYGYTVFESEAPPVAEALLDGATLFVGDGNGYDVILRALAISDYEKPAPVVVWAGEKCIDEVPYGILKRFSSVALYRYCYRDKQAAFALLDRYVMEGGHVFIETASSPDVASEHPPPLPIYRTERAEVRGSWDFSISTNPLLGNITSEGFSPPTYDSGPWGVSASNREGLREGAEALVSSGRMVLIAKVEHGKGRVVWSGMNLPYHALAYQNVEEANLLRRLVTAGNRPETLPVDMRRNSATSITFSLPPMSKGMIFRERYVSNLVFEWKASPGLGTKADVLMMGPGFVYVVLEDDVPVQLGLELYLSDGPLRIASFAVSGISAAAFLAYLFWRRHRESVQTFIP